MWVFPVLGREEALRVARIGKPRVGQGWLAGAPLLRAAGVGMSLVSCFSPGRPF